MAATANDGKRMRLLKQVLEKSLDKTTAAVSAAKLKQRFPTMLSGTEHSALPDTVVLSCFEQVMESIRVSTQDEFSNICAEFNVQEVLGNLDDVASSSPSKRKSTPRRVSCADDAAELAKHYTTRAKRTFLAELEASANEMEAENAALEKDVTEKRRKLGQEEAKLKPSQIVEAVQALETPAVSASYDSMSAWLPGAATALATDQ